MRTTAAVGAGAHDDLAELLRRDQLPLGGDGVLEHLIVADRRRADGAERRLMVLLLDRVCTSAGVMPSADMRSGFSQMRME
jgi:hypothetical protein